MKKILVTGPFEGAVELVYGEEGVGGGPGEPMTAQNMLAPLLSVDFGQVVVNDDRKIRLLGCIPMRYGPWTDGKGNEFSYEQAFPQKWGLKVIVENVELDFERDFWVPYGHKLNRKRSEAWWKRASRVKRAKAAHRLPAYLRHLSQHQWKNKANPETYLNDEYFETDWDNI